MFCFLPGPLLNPFDAGEPDLGLARVDIVADCDVTIFRVSGASCASERQKQVEKLAKLGAEAVIEIRLIPGKLIGRTSCSGSSNPRPSAL